MARAPGERWDCEGCGEPLVGARSKIGKVLPITVAPKDNGNVLLHRVHEPEGPSGEMVVCAWVLAGDTLGKARDNGVELRLNHFADCARAEDFKR